MRRSLRLAPLLAVVAFAGQASADGEAGANHAARRSTLGVEADFGVASRLGSIDTGFDATARQGLLFGGGLVWSPTRRFDVGLTYQRAGLGTEDLQPSGQFASARIDRFMNSAWLSVRSFPIRTETAGLFLGLMLGPSWETSYASLYLPPASPASTGTARRCSGSGPMSVALGASLGGEVALGEHLSMLTRVTGSSYRGSSDLLDDCFPGIGSAVTLDARLGFAWKFDVGPALDAP